MKNLTTCVACPTQTQGQWDLIGVVVVIIIHHFETTWVAATRPRPQVFVARAQ